VAISIFSDEEWRAFVDAIASPQWAEDQRFATADDRCRNADALDSFVESWTIQHTAEDVMSLLQAAGVAAGVVQTGADLSRDPQLKERGFFRRVLDHQGEYRTIESAPYKLSRTPGSVTKGAPAFGADLTYVLSEVLGMSDDELADCAIAGVFD
jgi:crotonobetainyl-CoA:carnitine CoA-transferase CaiB-like acyl-CoA transferase